MRSLRFTHTHIHTHTHTHTHTHSQRATTRTRVVVENLLLLFAVAQADCCPLRAGHQLRRSPQALLGQLRGKLSGGAVLVGPSRAATPCATPAACTMKSTLPPGSLAAHWTSTLASHAGLEARQDVVGAHPAD